MKETERIAEQLKRSFYGEAWSGPSVREVLEGVTAPMAAERAIREAHSIWELVHHITAWVEIVRKRIIGERIEVTAEVSFPPVSDRSEATWQESLRRMEEAETALRHAILNLPESSLNQIVGPGGDTVYVLLHGAVQHSLYHAGQIILMKRLLTNSQS